MREERRPVLQSALLFPVFEGLWKWADNKQLVQHLNRGQAQLTHCRKMGIFQFPPYSIEWNIAAPFPPENALLLSESSGSFRLYQAKMEQQCAR